MPNYFNQLYPNNIQMPQNQSEIKWVQGEAGAKSYLIAPNQTVVLFDSEASTIYLKSADQMGMPSIKVLDYTIRDNSPEIDSHCACGSKEELDQLRNEINELKKMMEGKEKSDESKS